jgi:hypothetical protein
VSIISYFNIWQTISTRKGGVQWTHPTPLNNKNQWKWAQEDSKQKQDRAEGRARTGWTLKRNIWWNNINRQANQRFATRFKSFFILYFKLWQINNKSVWYFKKKAASFKNLARTSSKSCTFGWLKILKFCCVQIPQIHFKYNSCFLTFLLL